MVFDRYLKSRQGENEGFFQKVPFEPEALKNLRLKLKDNLPRSTQLYNISLSHAQGRPFQGIIQCDFYEYVNPKMGNGPNGARIEDIFIIYAKNVGVIMLPPENPTPDMVIALELLLNWEESIVFHTIPESFWYTYLKPIVATYEGGTCPGSFCHVKEYYLTNEEASQIQLTLPVSYSVKPLAVQDVPCMMTDWIYGHDRSETLIKQLLHTAPSCGLYVRKSGGENEDVGEELASSLIVSTVGQCNILFTKEHHRGKGYGKIVIKHLVKEAAEKLGHFPLIETAPDNMACQKCIEKCGFHDELQNAVWYWYK